MRTLIQRRTGLDRPAQLARQLLPLVLNSSSLLGSLLVEMQGLSEESLAVHLAAALPFT